MSPKHHRSYPVTRLSDARRQHADSKKPFQRLTRSEPNRVRTGNSDWGADEADSFCTPGAEEYTWNTRSQRCNRYGVMIDNLMATGANDDEEQRENPVVRKHVRRAVAESVSQSGSDGKGWAAWRRWRLVRVERCVLRLREDFRHLARAHGWTGMGLGGDGHARLLLEGIDDEEGEDADDEGAADSDGGGTPSVWKARS